MNYLGFLQYYFDLAQVGLNNRDLNIKYPGITNRYFLKKSEILEKWVYLLYFTHSTYYINM